MTAAERRRINRANGAQSRGPKTDATKAISSRNRLKHGLCAQVHALPNEDPHEAHDDATRWLEHYRPHTEHQHELVERIAGACLLQRRCQRAYAATIAAQVLNAEADLDRAHEAEVDAFKTRLVADPAAAVAGLRRTALGCRWLIARWTRLRDHLDCYGSLADPDCDEMVRLCGIGRGRRKQGAIAPEHFEIGLHCELARPGPHCYALQSVPEGLRASYRERWKDPAANRAELLGRIDAALAELTEREERLRTGREAVERATAADRALVIADPDQARLWVRYYNESNSAFFRASRELQRSLEEDEGSEMTVNEACSPNEPNDPIESTLSADIEVSFGGNAAIISEYAGAASSAGDPGGAGLPAAPTTPGAEPVPGAADGPSRNEPNGAAAGDLSEGLVDGYALKALIASSPLAAALWERTLRLRRRIDDPVERARLIRDQERDLAAWDEEMRRMEALIV